MEVREFPECDNRVLNELEARVRDLGRFWAGSNPPRPDSESLRRWDQLIADWISAENVPLFARRFSERYPRGSVQTQVSGRELIPADNTPAHWAFLEAFRATDWTLEAIKQTLHGDLIPVAMMLNSQEKTTARYFRSGRKGLLNAKGWKLCHAVPVHLGRGNLLTHPVSDVEEHFRRFMSPSNMFLVPISFAGLGEAPSFIELSRVPRAT